LAGFPIVRRGGAPSVGRAGVCLGYPSAAFLSEGEVSKIADAFFSRRLGDDKSINPALACGAIALVEAFWIEIQMMRD
jgi:hypothetical protein